MHIESSLARRVADDAGHLNGRWMVVAGLLGGVRLPRMALNELTLILQDGRFTLGVDEGRIAVDWDTCPASMDVLVVRGPNRGRFIPAVFERCHATLRICFDLSGLERPTSFVAPPGTRRFLATYRLCSSPPARHEGALNVLVA